MRHAATVAPGRAGFSSGRTWSGPPLPPSGLPPAGLSAPAAFLPSAGGPPGPARAVVPALLDATRRAELEGGDYICPPGEAAYMTREQALALLGGQQLPMWLPGAGPCTEGDGGRLPVLDKFTGEPFAWVPQASREQMLDAVAVIHENSPKTLGALPAWQRRGILLRIAADVRADWRRFATAISLENGKPWRDSITEVMRSIDVLEQSAEVVTAMGGEWRHLDESPRAEGLSYRTQRFPLPLALLVTPFNFPLNLVMHKIGPAIAAGTGFLLKPAARTPVSSMLLGEILARHLPAGCWGIAPCQSSLVGELLADGRVSVASFTGSPAVGLALRQVAHPTLHLVLELGGNAATIVDQSAVRPGPEGAGDIDRLAARITAGGLGQSGQSCISVQRLFVHREHYDALRQALVERFSRVRSGCPFDPATDIGPVVSLDAARRIHQRVRDAIDNHGGKLLAGGVWPGTDEQLDEQATPGGAGCAPGTAGSRCDTIPDPCGGPAVLYPATLLEGVDASAGLAQLEVFGPVVLLQAFDDFDAVLAQVNDSQFGLQAGLFCRDVARIEKAFRVLHVGGLVVNNVSNTRADAQPYGGLKDSGIGREGPRRAIESFSEERVMLMQHID
ncbi:hypothetical protein, variant [Fonticula alba]|nr:hypothetical protein, variant [Fonticula alba]KCV69860.1 hypothetical protein, variant [Fonticula alba]|eukprot:XP_009495466.1 hypothetical protein, variant [Fonticula alba]